jgi:hypothetical protein
MEEIAARWSSGYGVNMIYFWFQSGRGELEEEEEREEEGEEEEDVAVAVAERRCRGGPRCEGGGVVGVHLQLQSLLIAP